MVKKSENLKKSQKISCLAPGSCTCAGGFLGTNCRQKDREKSSTSSSKSHTSSRKIHTSPTSFKKTQSSTTSLRKIQSSATPLRKRHSSPSSRRKTHSSCSPPCQHGGRCRRSGRCRCAPGYRGPLCQWERGGRGRRKGGRRKTDRARSLVQQYLRQNMP